MTKNQLRTNLVKSGFTVDRLVASLRDMGMITNRSFLSAWLSRDTDESDKLHRAVEALIAKNNKIRLQTNFHWN